MAKPSTIKSAIVTVTNDLNQDQRMHRICNTLLDEGIEVLLVGRKKKTSSDLLSQRFKQHRMKCFFSSGVFFYVEFNIRLFFFLIFKHVDLLYSVDLDTIGSVGLAARIRSKKHIHDAHEYFVEVPELEGKSFKKSIWNKLADSYYPRCDLRMTVNEELANVLSSRYKVGFEVLKSAPVLNPSFQKKEGDTRIILYQGVLNKGRGLEQAIKAISAMSGEIELHIAGEGDLSEELRSLKGKLDTQNKVRFLGWKSGNELKEVTSSAWIGLNLLSSDSMNYKYSLANKFFDYMHAEIPSLNMNFPVYQRICSVNKVGICLSELTSSNIQKAIKELLDSPTQYDEMVLACKEAKKVYNWQNEAVKLKSYLTKIANI